MQDLSTATPITPDMIVEPTVAPEPVPLKSWARRGARFGQYELLRPLGQGSFGAVFKARDCKLARTVAIKFLCRDKETQPGATEPDDTDRFFREARATARCVHDNIVVIHEVGAHRGTPYMVLELLDGAPLSKLVHDGTKLPWAQAVDLIVPVVRALEAAHALGIVHRDLKPANIMLTKSGVIKVVDFGVAKLGHGEPTLGMGSGELPAVLGPDDRELTGEGTVIGTVSCMSPEQCRGAEVDAQTDLWAVGILLFRSVAGHHPLNLYPEAPNYVRDLLTATADLDEATPSARSVCPEIPDELADVIDRCLLKPKDQRFASATELLKALEPLRPGRERRQLGSGESPYPGLQPFEATDVHRFFGRPREIGAGLAHLRDMPLLGVVGPSGVGKSSLVRAGLVPALKASGESWRSIVLRPGRHPMQALAQALAKAQAPLPDGATRTSITVPADPSQQPSIVERLYDEPGYFGAELRSRARSRGQNIVVFVDQFEELYTQVPDARERIAFTACLSAICDDVSAPLRLVIAVRSDFLDHVVESPALFAELKRGLFFLSAPDRDGLRDAIVQPAEMAGYRFDEPALIEAMLDQVERTPGALPLLQFAASRLWETRDRERRLLTADSYRRLRGIAGALASHADAVVAECTSSEQAIMRALLLRLVTPERTRAIVPASELYELSPDAAEVHRVIDRLVRSRLVIGQTTVSESGGTAAGGSVELVHESLIHSWPLLRRWLDENQDDAVIVDQLRTAARQWAAKRQDPGLLWRGEAMEEAKRWYSRFKGALPELQRAYLDAVFAMAAKSTRRKRLAVMAALGFMSILVIAAGVAIVMITDAQQETKTQARRVEDQLHLTQAAEVTAKTERNTANVERKKAVDANQKLEGKNAALVTAVEEAKRAQREADEARLRAVTAQRYERRSKRRATESAEIARAAATAAKLAGERLEVLLAQEQKRVQELEELAKGAQIVTTVKKREGEENK